MNKIDLLVGIRAEQSLRDTLRTVTDDAGLEDVNLELTPVGRKDWVAGKRLSSVVECSELPKIEDSVLKELISLDSKQRVRRENIRMFAVVKPVPVFKDPFVQEELEEQRAIKEATENQQSGLGSSTACPICKRTVHSYNLQHDTTGKVVGCFMCGGDPGRY